MTNYALDNIYIIASANLDKGIKKTELVMSSVFLCLYASSILFFLVREVASLDIADIAAHRIGHDGMQVGITA